MKNKIHLHNAMLETGKITCKNGKTILIHC